MEISGELSVTFPVRNAGDLQRIMAMCQEYGGQAVLQPEGSRPHRKGLKPSASKEETYEKIVSALKLAFPQGFSMKEAAAYIHKELGYGNTTTRHAISWARKKESIVKHGNGYFDTEPLKKKVADQMPKEIEVAQVREPVPLQAASV